MATRWIQRTIEIAPKRRGCHLITDEILRGVPEFAEIDVGLCHCFLQHTSASLTLNENCDKDVRLDMEDTLNRIVPEDREGRGLYRHDMEGPDDFPAHVKSSLLGASVDFPVSGGRPMLGTWQGVWLCEHRDRGSARRIVVTLQGQAAGASAARGR